MKLPKQFVDRMATMLGDELQSFMDTYDTPSHTGLRLNTLKLNNVDLLNEFNLTPIKWCNTGYYYHNSTPGKHVYHNAGLYYIQEPSAMAVVELADVKHNECVLDLCAAPGGKSTHIACKLGDTGLLVANEIVPNRAKVLSENIERCGITQSIVTNETPERLANAWGEIFDKVFVDAPCSGEGMFRKDATAIQEWSVEHTLSCHTRQLEILKSADRLVKAGGKLIYSTCTFAPVENEGTVDEFLKLYPNYHVVKVQHDFDCGNLKLVNSNNAELKNCMRIYPHHTSGEGHFIAIFQKDSGETIEPKLQVIKQSNKASQIIAKWYKDNLNIKFTDKIMAFGDNIYAVPNICLRIDKLKVLRYGLQLGSTTKDIFTPSHSLAMALKICDFVRVQNIDLDHAISYLRGNTLETNLDNGWCAIAYNGFVLGFGKVVGGVIKNHYPKGLRI